MLPPMMGPMFRVCVKIWIKTIMGNYGQVTGSRASPIIILLLLLLIIIKAWIKMMTDRKS
jgi:hypothetical protein